MWQNYLGIALVDGMALGLLARRVSGNKLLAARKKRKFLQAIFCTAVILLAELGSGLPFAGVGGGAPLPRWQWGLLAASNAVGFALTPLLPVLLAVVFHPQRGRLYVLAPQLICAVLAVASPATGAVFALGADGGYRRGPLFWAFVTAYGYGLAMLLCAVWLEGRRYSRRPQEEMYFLVVFAAAGTTLQLVYPAIHTSWTCVTLALFGYYAFVCEYDDSFDPLTHLFNRRAFEQELARLADAPRAAAVQFDLNDFKQVNDRYGHAFGDVCLCDAAACVREGFCGIGTAYRIGGDEFCVLCPEADAAAMTAALTRVSALEARRRREDPRRPTLAAGWCLRGEFPGGTLPALLAEADRRRYADKAAHRQSAEKKAGL